MFDKAVDPLNFILVFDLEPRVPQDMNETIFMNQLLLLNLLNTVKSRLSIPNLNFILESLRFFTDFQIGALLDLSLFFDADFSECIGNKLRNVLMGLFVQGLYFDSSH